MVKFIFTSMALTIFGLGIAMQPQIIIWDNDGTVMGSKNPNDITSSAKVILPNVADVMQRSGINIICSGTKTAESELQNWDPVKIIEQFNVLMEKLPVSLATFSPAIGGVECWVMIKHATGNIEIRKAHEDPRYQHLIGHFKKPDIGMLVVIRDLVTELFAQAIDASTTVFIGDAWQDQQAAQNFGIPFVDAHKIHTMALDTKLMTLVNYNIYTHDFSSK